MISYEEEPDILSIHVRGSLTGQDMITVVRTSYPRLQGRAVLWNLAHGDMLQLEDEDFDRLTHAVAALPDTHLPRRTACFAPNPASFVRFCTYMTHALKAEIPVQYCTFSDLCRAQEWLRSGR